MIKLALYIFLTILGFQFLISCVDSHGLDIYESRAHKADILPLLIGNSWTYGVSLYNEFGDIIEEYEIVYAIMDEVTIADEQWYVQDQGLPAPGVKTYLVNRSDGLWQKSNINSPPLRLVQYPIYNNSSEKVGQFYNSKTQKTYDIHRTASSLNVNLNVKAGNFRTIAYLDFIKDDSSALQDTLNLIHYAPNKGMIKRIRYKQADNGELYLSEKWELIKLEVKLK